MKVSQQSQKEDYLTESSILLIFPFLTTKVGLDNMALANLLQLIGSFYQKKQYKQFKAMIFATYL